MSEIEPWAKPRTLAERAVEEWEHLEIRCIVVPLLGLCSFNGYVQIPAELREMWNALKLVGPHLHIPGDEPYGPDRENWLGFSTTGNDVWDVADLKGFFTDEQILQRTEFLHQSDEFQDLLDKVIPVPDEYKGPRKYHTWTRTELHQRVNELAEQVALRLAMRRIGLSQNEQLQHRLTHALNTYAEMCTWIENERERLRPEGGYFNVALLDQQSAEDATFTEVVMKIAAELPK